MAGGELKRMTVAEFRASGLLQEVNRRLLHPLGLALESTTNEDGTESIHGLWDHRDDPEGIRYVGITMADRAAAFDARWNERLGARVNALGYMVQPPVDEEGARPMPR
jgi:hypothetical protein